MGGTTEELRDYAEHSVLYSCQENAGTYYLACRVDQGKFLQRDTSEKPDPKSRDAYKHNVADIWNNVVKDKSVSVGSISDDYCVW